ncbi:MAG: tRNA uridine-5-carboxymethylaminomethyl(34) synthesis GTPase MnmE [Chlamydiota bacterium]
MEFTHRSYELGETIAAIATPPGAGGVAIVRISGKQALFVASRIFSGPVQSYRSHTAHFGAILNQAGDVIDRGLALVMRGPHSYTGEDTVEFHCHGGVLITRKVLNAALKAGARAALPGEFTFQAFQNGKIDLTQAEAVQQVIAARSERAWQAAENQLEGKLREKITAFQHQLTEIGALFEAWVDFPEEGLEFQSEAEVERDLTAIAAEMKLLGATFYDGKKLQLGYTLCLLGAPNVGKSSLMNALLNQERAIVTPIAGTTRDLIAEELSFAGLTFQLVDTAGIRETAEVIEREGIKRTVAAVKDADLVLLILDAAKPKTKPPLLELLSPAKTIIIWNKVDLPHDTLPSFSFPHEVRVSAKQITGLEELKQQIEMIIWQGNAPSKEEVILSSERHFRALTAATKAVNQVRLGLKNQLSPEFLAADLRFALTELGTIIGVNVTEDLLNRIFAKFCVGK